MGERGRPRRRTVGPTRGHARHSDEGYRRRKGPGRSTDSQNRGRSPVSSLSTGRPLYGRDVVLGDRDSVRILSLDLQRE